MIVKNIKGVEYFSELGENTSQNNAVTINEELVRKCLGIVEEIRENVREFIKCINSYDNIFCITQIHKHMEAIDIANKPYSKNKYYEALYSRVGDLSEFEICDTSIIYQNSVGLTKIVGYTIDDSGEGSYLSQIEEAFEEMLKFQSGLELDKDFEDTTGKGSAITSNKDSGDTADKDSTITPNKDSGDTTGDVGNPNSTPDGEVVTSLPGVDNEDVVLEDDDIILEDDPIIYDGEYPEDENIVVEEIDNNQNNSIWNDDLLNGGLGAGVGSGVVYPWVNDWNNNWDNTGNNPWDQNWNDNVGDPVIPNPEIPNDNEENKDDGKPEVEFVNIGSDEVAIETPLVAGIGGGIIGNIGAGGGSTITKPEFNDPTEDKKEPNISYTINDMEFINPAENDPRFMANDDLDTLVDSDNVDNLDDNIIDSAITDSTINNEENNLEIDNITDIFDNDEVDNLDTENEPEFFKTAGVAGIGLAGLAGVGLKKDKDKEKKKDE